MPAVLLVRPAGPLPVPAVAPAVAAGELAVIRTDDAVELADAYWRAYRATAHEFPRADALEDIERFLVGGYGPAIAGASRLHRVGGGVVAGVLTVREAPYDDVPPIPFVIDLFVVPDHRRRGLGRALMVTAIDAVPHEPIGLRVEPDNKAARALYAGLGFAPHRA